MNDILLALTFALIGQDPTSDAGFLRPFVDPFLQFLDRQILGIRTLGIRTLDPPGTITHHINDFFYLLAIRLVQFTGTFVGVEQV
ncbi:hypothetical protein, partial [Thiolapillus sp.]|uniref:hypothetical protein n=1 Tax=Thiolapillus sp. TaxID=2017437 RepID=UPI0025DC657E